ncbi:MAG: IS5/IS1182 family transposase, partial [Parachlamydiaceae bacterium]|nr:IS5/IS1182 family transposase [Parachlamydiaceae bacterium]
MSFRQILSQFWSNVQYTLFPQLEKDLGELSPDHKKLVAILELVRIEEFIPCGRFTNGRLKEDRSAIARAFIAKIVFKLPYTKNILKELKNDKQLKKICGWE